MRIQHSAGYSLTAIALTWAAASLASGAQVWVTGVLEESPAKYSRCVAVSEDGQWVVGNSIKTNASSQLVNTAFYWSKATGLTEMYTSSGDSVVTGCATASDGTLLACGNVGGLARKWQGGGWHILPADPAQADGNPRSVYAISHSTAIGETWIVGSSYPDENEKAYRYRGSNNSYINFWGYYQDAYGVANNGWAVGKNNWGNGQTNPDWRYDHAIFIFDWNVNCAGGGNCGWDQLRRFSGYGDTNFYKSRATAINPNATWAVGYQTYNAADLSLYHAFKWQVPASPSYAPEPGLNWPRPIDLGTLGAGDTLSYAYCVSNVTTNGPVIGGTSYGSVRHSGYKAVYWDNGGIHDLYTTLTSKGVDMSRWNSLSRITGISANGTVLVGYGLFDDDDNPGTPAIEMGFYADLVGSGPVPPVITQHPLAQYRCYGGDATFNVGATGAGVLAYQWKKDGVPLSNGGHYSGVFTKTLTIINADANDLASYSCTVTNADGQATSNAAALTLASAPPAAPVDAPPVATASDKISWRWGDVAGESGLRVKDAASQAKSSDLAADVKQWIETGLTANTRYQRHVYAFNACGESAGSAGQARHTLAMQPIYGTGTSSPSVSSDKGFSLSGLAPNASVTFTATNGFGDGPEKVGQFGYLWNQTPGDPSNWSGEQLWTGGNLVKQVGASGSWYLHLRSYNNDSPKSAAAGAFNLGPYTVGGVSGSNCVQNPGFENGFINGVASSWVKYNYSGTVTCSDSTVQYRSGAHAQAITSANSSNEGGVYQQFSTVPGQTYTVSIWIKCSNSTTESYLGVDPFGGTSPSSSNVQWASNASTNWVRIAWTGVAQAGKITLYADALSTNSSSGTVWVDDVEPACGTIPDTPADGVAQALSTTSIRWKWTDVATETGYRVIDSNGTNLSGDLPANTTQWDETTGIAANTQYSRRIVAFNASGASGPSAGQNRYSLIETPTGVAFGNVTATSIDASASGTLSNLNSGSSGSRVTNTTLNTNSGWRGDRNPWTSANLAPNTVYDFVARARNGEAVETADSAMASMWTLSAPVTAESITADKPAACVGSNVQWTAVGGFGAGHVQYYRYAWDQNPTYFFTGQEPTWSSGNLTTVASSAGNWYLHVRGYNGANVPNGTFDYPLIARTAVLADLDGDCDVDTADAAIFIACNSGPQVMYDPQALPAGCTLTPDVNGRIAPDFDVDGDVDQSDFGTFQRCITGEDGSAAPGCGG